MHKHMHAYSTLSAVTEYILVIQNSYYGTIDYGKLARIIERKSKCEAAFGRWIKQRPQHR